LNQVPNKVQDQVYGQVLGPVYYQVQDHVSLQMRFLSHRPGETRLDQPRGSWHKARTEP